MKSRFEVFAVGFNVIQDKVKMVGFDDKI